MNPTIASNNKHDKAKKLAVNETPVVTHKPLPSTASKQVVSLTSNDVEKAKPRPVSDAPSQSSRVAKVEAPKAVQITDDSDGDGLSNAVELAAGMNPMSADSDNDGVPDFIEIGRSNQHPQDSDQDGRPDALDPDDDNDGILTKVEIKGKKGQMINKDTDKDGVPNYLDANDDGDSRLTKLEGAEKDSDNDGIPDYLDNNDGISTVKKAKVVVLYDESDQSNRSVKKPTVTFGLAAKDTQTDAK